MVACWWSPVTGLKITVSRLAGATAVMGPRSAAEPQKEKQKAKGKKVESPAAGGAYIVFPVHLCQVILGLLDTTALATSVPVTTPAKRGPQ